MLGILEEILRSNYQSRASFHLNEASILCFSLVISLMKVINFLFYVAFSYRFRALYTRKLYDLIASIYSFRLLDTIRVLIYAIWLSIKGNQIKING